MILSSASMSSGLGELYLMGEGVPLTIASRKESASFVMTTTRMRSVERYCLMARFTSASVSFDRRSLMYVLKSGVP